MLHFHLLKSGQQTFLNHETVLVLLSVHIPTDEDSSSGNAYYMHPAVAHFESRPRYGQS
jgi:CRISPR/Cas system CSM-associated protein Csm4 (group 5 of RAMP superfamily)